MKEGDRNTKFYHIDQLMVQSEIIEEPARIEVAINEFYHNCIRQLFTGDLLLACSLIVQLSQLGTMKDWNFDEVEVLRCLKV